MSDYLVPQADGLMMRPAGSWGAEKPDYLARYLAMFTISMREKPWRVVCQELCKTAGKGSWVDSFLGICNLQKCKLRMPA